jgi:hypothetical protein
MRQPQVKGQRRRPPPAENLSALVHLKENISRKLQQPTQAKGGLEWATTDHFEN